MWRWRRRRRSSGGSMAARCGSQLCAGGPRTRHAHTRCRAPAPCQAMMAASAQQQTRSPPEASWVTGMPITPNICFTPSRASARATTKQPLLGWPERSTLGAGEGAAAPPPARRGRGGDGGGRQGLYKCSRTNETGGLRSAEQSSVQGGQSRDGMCTEQERGSDAARAGRVTCLQRGGRRRGADPCRAALASRLPLLFQGRRCTHPPAPGALLPVLAGQPRASPPVMQAPARNHLASPQLPLPQLK